MTRHTVITSNGVFEQCDNLAEQIRASLDYLSRWHNHPTRLKDIPAAENTWYNNQAPQHRQHSTRPESMRVI